MSIEVTTATAPANWACYLMYSDASGFDYYNTSTDKAGDRDRAMVDRWVERLAKDGWYVVGCEGEPWFAHSCDAIRNFDGDIIEYTLHRQVTKCQDCLGTGDCLRGGCDEGPPHQCSTCSGSGKAVKK